MQTKFHGQFSDLQKAVALTHEPGYWKDLGNHQQFRAHSGAVLNWWRSTGTLHFQGPAAEARDLAEKCDQAMSLEAVVPIPPPSEYRDPIEPRRRRPRRRPQPSSPQN